MYTVNQKFFFHLKYFHQVIVNDIFFSEAIVMIYNKKFNTYFYVDSKIAVKVKLFVIT